MVSKFTEKETEQFYDQADEIYQAHWSKDGSVHWGYFDEENINFSQASQRLTDLLIEKAHINRASMVLDVGCGNGTTALCIAERFGCKVIGIDLSGVRIKNALERLKEQPEDIQEKVQFIKSSATTLPFENNFFSSVLSQSSLYHVHDKEKALKEIYRVLKKDGVFVFDDLFKPSKEISADTQKYVYDRLLFDTPFTFESYKAYLEQIGFHILETEDHATHLQKSYAALIDILKKKLFSKNNRHQEKYEKLIFSYQKTIDAVSHNELGYALYVCQKK